ncbi:MAG TPA: hypothetical protein DE015_08825 [Oceanospirillales bacterium]|nr:hypothetical protein [Oceanospirillales bacterium]
MAIIVEASLTNGDTDASVAAAVYDSGQPAPMVGGNLLEVTSESVAAILSGIDERDNFYSGQIGIPNPDTDTIKVAIVHRPQETRQERWYPTEDILVDPGPGEFEGFEATLLLPTAIEITAPQPGLTYSSRDDIIPLEWTGSPADDFKLVTYNRCRSSTDSKDLSWVTTSQMDDDQQENIRIGDIIPATGVLETSANLGDVVTGFVQFFIEATLSAATLGLYEPTEINFDEFELDYCTIQLSLVRQRQGQIGEDFSGGSITGSRSDNLQVEYRP